MILLLKFPLVCLNPADAADVVVIVAVPLVIVPGARVEDDDIASRCEAAFP